MSDTILAARAALLKEAIMEAERFLKIGKIAMRTILLEEEKPFREQRCQLMELASAKRASLDLTRALAAFRR